MSDTSRCVSIVATSHDSQGTVTWQSEDGQKYISANSNANTPLLFDSEYKTAGKLLHETGSYYLKQTCEKSCRCTDCDQNSALLQAAEMHTAGMFSNAAAGLSKMGKGFANGVKKAGSVMKAAYNAGKKEYSDQKEAHEHLAEAKKQHGKALEALNKITKTLSPDQQQKLEEVKKALANAALLMADLDSALQAKTEAKENESV